MHYLTKRGRLAKKLIALLRKRTRKEKKKNAELSRLPSKRI
jgi:antitoxin (DNA-binding transcriptional repressor) of toxin-antitoxin stability system